MKTSEVLRKAKAVIYSPEKWCKGAYAMDAGGEDTISSSDDACQWCAVGAINRAAGVRNFRSAAEKVLEKLTPGKCISNYNDALETTHADIMALFDRAIQVAEEDEKE